jgi:hypothetical protein
LWVVLIFTLKNPIYTKNLYVPFKEFKEDKLSNLELQKGIIEWYKNENEELLVIKYDSKIIHEEKIYTLIN